MLDWLCAQELCHKWTHSDIRIWLTTKATLFKICCYTLPFSFSLSLINTRVILNDQKQQHLVSVTWNMLWLIQECFLVMWHKPHSFGGWAEHLYSENFLSNQPTKDLVAHWISTYIVFSLPSCFCLEALEISFHHLNSYAFNLQSSLVTYLKYPAFFCHLPHTSSWWLQWLSWYKLNSFLMELDLVSVVGELKEKTE